MAKSKFLRSIGVGLAALIVSSAIAVGAGLFPGFPIVSGASYCNGYATGTSGQVCIQTVPAGPSLTGNELIPADTQLASGQSPQTVLVPSRVLGGGAATYYTATNATNYTVSNLTGKLILTPASTLTTTTLTLPAAADLLDGQSLELSSTATLTAVVITAGSGTSISNTPTALTVSTTGAYGYKFIYRASNTTWYRLQ